MAIETRTVSLQIYMQPCPACGVDHLQKFERTTATKATGMCKRVGQLLITDIDAPVVRVT